MFFLLPTCLWIITRQIIYTRYTEAMKKSFFFVFSIFIILFGFTAHAQSSEAVPTSTLGEVSYVEQINSMDFHAVINPDSTVSVTETIEYNFAEENKHGIYRTIPLGFIGEGEPDHTTIKEVNVVDELGNPYTYTITSRDPLNIKIGDPDILISGVHTYKISYTIARSIGYYSDRDEFYWNITGNDFEVQIEEVSATIELPESVDMKKITTYDYCGYKGVNETCGDFTILNNTVSYKTYSDTYFDAGEGVTLAVGFPKGNVALPTKSDFYFATLSKIWFIPLPFILAYFWFRKRFKNMMKSRKYFKNNTIIAEYDAKDFNPFEAGLLVNGNITKKDISSLIIHLAIKGYLKIEDKDGEFCFTKIKEPGNDLSESEKNIILALSGKCESGLGVSEAENFYTALSMAGTRLVGKEYISPYSNKVSINSNIARIILPLFLALNPGLFLWLLVGTWAGFAFSGACVLIAIINIFWKNSSVYPTEKGFEEKRYLLGLREYIRVAEKDRINFANAPAKTPELFEKLLPYAMIFGYEEKWAKEFEDIYIANPVWYSNSDTNRFTTLALLASMRSVSTATDRAIASAVKSSSSSWRSSSGGSSGGGSSGGGGGGGGGGSW